MSEPQKRGRKKRPRTTAEKLLIAEFSEKLSAKMEAEHWNATQTAKKLKICPASLYNYLRKADLPRYEVLKRAHDLWGWNFQHIDFAAQSARSPSEIDQPRQYILPFIESVRERDIKIIRAKSVKPDCLELTVQIRFVS